MACDTACVGTSPHVWSSSGDTAPSPRILGASQSRSKLPANSVPFVGDEAKSLQLGSQNVNNICADNWNEHHLESMRTIDGSRCHLGTSENISVLQRGLREDVSNIRRQFGYFDTNDRKSRAEESENTAFPQSGFPESVAQSKELDDHYTIPKILLEPPPSPSTETIRGTTVDDLPTVPRQTGYLSTHYLYSDYCLGQHDLMTSNDSGSCVPSTECCVELPCRYQQRLQQDLENSNVVLDETNGSDVSRDDKDQREADLGTALKWIRQEICNVSAWERSIGISVWRDQNLSDLEMKEQDKSLLKQFIELRASILQLRCLCDPDLQGSCSDVSSVGSGSTYSLNEPATAAGGGGMTYSSSISNNINRIHINSSSNCSVLKSPHQLRRMLLKGGSDFGTVSGRGAGASLGSRGTGGPGGGVVSLSLPNSPRVARLRWRSDQII
ncbi:hypothetical protein EGW08_016152 [Elysia chlorotica]|uniref:Uncharacterized protein n=1 Tax=Elysia chlorotica TaxID=188477 RepID=A0A3S0ZV87_ELYCH|nr:hypothetical protein EGW08_016152 [Elysia chlorotica]